MHDDSHYGFMDTEMHRLCVLPLWYGA